MHMMQADQATQAAVRAIVMREKTMSLSEREWKHRLRGYGYALRESAEGLTVMTLPHNVEVCAL